jgi:hypothetical protein
MGDLDHYGIDSGSDLRNLITQRLDPVRLIALYLGHVKDCPGTGCACPIDSYCKHLAFNRRHRRDGYRAFRVGDKAPHFVRVFGFRGISPRYLVALRSSRFVKSIAPGLGHTSPGCLPADCLCGLNGVLHLLGLPLTDRVIIERCDSCGVTATGRSLTDSSSRRAGGAGCPRRGCSGFVDSCAIASPFSHPNLL